MTKKMWNVECGMRNEKCGKPSAFQVSSFSFQLSAFTLIELLVVIAIIAILAGLILNTAGYIQKKGAMSRAQAEIAALENALERYKADNGDYPASATYTNSGVGSNSLYGVLCPSSGKVYFEFNKGMTSSLGIVDPFGTNYGYQYPGSTNRNGSNFFDVWSTAGTTASTNNEPKWIKNW
ncbi:MAG: prepilin-type N-terminal cleavage/methylation domain-containing protein [Verrucomicrobiaceae bacterium]|nr:MAG: prepilin-type N-terminal cleavage/methylation domain-containing protein [Verrucomicrobiaceae bacterium]